GAVRRPDADTVADLESRGHERTCEPVGGRVELRVGHAGSLVARDERRMVGKLPRDAFQERPDRLADERFGPDAARIGGGHGRTLQLRQVSGSSDGGSGAPYAAAAPARSSRGTSATPSRSAIVSTERRR